jgi:hypothetical protein
VIRRHFGCERFKARKQEWQQAESILQIVYNMRQIGTIEHVSATMIAMTWREFKKSRLTKAVNAWREMYVAQARSSY